MIPNAWRGFDFALGEDVDALRETVSRFAQDRESRLGARADAPQSARSVRADVNLLML